MSLHPVPSLLVQRIHTGEFIDMCDFLADNALVRQHFEGIHSALSFQVLPMMSRPRSVI